ncbi:hypothetical protein SMWOGL2_14540 [Sporomusa malonica]
MLVDAVYGLIFVGVSTVCTLAYMYFRIPSK